MGRRVALVTGANAGMGKATVAALADRGMHVVMLCRNERRGRQALDELGAVPSRSLELMLCDLGSMADIRRFASEFSEAHDHLDVLVNSAGVITLDRRETADGLELQFGTNHIGHFLLTLRLLGALAKGDGPRIVVVGSGAHRVGRIHFDDLNLTRGYNVARAYGQAKLANLLFCRELDRRLRAIGSPITVNVTHPGAVATQMGVDRETGFGRSVVRLIRPFMLTPEQGASTAVFLATDDSVSGVSGQYFYRSRQYRTSRRGTDGDAARRLFEVSEQLTGYTFDEAMDGVSDQPDGPRTPGTP